MYSKHKNELQQFFKAVSAATHDNAIASVSEPFDILKDYPSTWPNIDLAGVYLFLSETGELLYVGESSFLGARLNSHFHYSEDRRSGKPVSTWAADTRYVITISLKAEFRWLALALETFLVASLNPKRNIIGNT